MRRRARRRASSCARGGFWAPRARPRGTKPEIGRDVTAMSRGGITAETGFRTGFAVATSAATGGDATRPEPRRASNAPVKSPVEAFKSGEPTESGTEEARGGGGAGATMGTGGNEGKEGGGGGAGAAPIEGGRKRTRLNSSHLGL